jgi:hypothetical protein
VLQDLWQQLASEGKDTKEVHSLTFQGENPRFSLIWLCLAMTLLKALRAETFFRVKTYDL